MFSKVLGADDEDATNVTSDQDAAGDGPRCLTVLTKLGLMTNHKPSHQDLPNPTREISQYNDGDILREISFQFISALYIFSLLYCISTDP
jgi:hypothetical protein